MTKQQAINQHTNLTERLRALRLRIKDNQDGDGSLTTEAASLEREISRLSQVHNPRISIRSRDTLDLI